MEKILIKKSFCVILFRSSEKRFIILEWKFFSDIFMRKITVATCFEVIIVFLLLFWQCIERLFVDFSNKFDNIIILITHKTKNCLHVHFEATMCTIASLVASLLSIFILYKKTRCSYFINIEEKCKSFDTVLLLTDWMKHF